SRGDRRLGAVIQRAWQLGAKFDAWQDQYDYQKWLQAFADCEMDPDFYSHRERGLEEVLPWSHISTAVRSNFLKEDYLWSKEGKLRADCRDHCFACGILPTFNELRVSTPDEAWKCPPVHRKTVEA
ncbi:MAG: B12-binding domain-containing radical SAM protein, partial [Anaerolineae bacterium]|nr:B12-binding domain-containing radical SAM protein [Anaerolineae bacterium]